MSLAAFELGLNASGADSIHAVKASCGLYVIQVDEDSHLPFTYAVFPDQARLFSNRADADQWAGELDGRHPDEGPFLVEEFRRQPPVPEPAAEGRPRGTGSSR